MKIQKIVPAMSFATLMLLGCSKESVVMQTTYKKEQIQSNVQTSSLFIEDESSELLVIQLKPSEGEEKSEQQSASIQAIKNEEN